MKNILAVLCVASVLHQPAVAAPTYERDVAPILRAYCANCHSGREAEAEFSVERYATLRAGGSEAGDPVVPGDARSSGLIRRIVSREADHMPPADEPQPTAADLATLEAWVTAGAVGPAADTSILETLVVPTVAAFAGPQPVTAATISPDGGRIAVARGRSLEIVVVENGLPVARPLVAFPDPPAKVAALHFSPDGSRLVVAGGIPGLRGVAEIRDASTGKLVASFGGHRDMLYDAELSPDGTTLATAGYDRSIKLWKVADSSLERSIDVHNGAVLDLAWHPSGKILGSASADETVKLWRAADGVRLDTFSQPQGEVSSLTFTPDGRHVIAAGRDRRIHLWRLASLDAAAVNPEVQARFAHEAPIVALALSADGRRLVTAAEDGSLKSWTVPDLLPGEELARKGDVVSALAASPGRLLVGRLDGALDLMPLSLGGVDQPAAAPQAAAPAAAVSQSMPVSQVGEVEPNDAPAQAAEIAVPAVVSGAIGAPGDADCFRFAARAGEPLVLEVIAASAKPPSRLDSRLEVLDAQGRPVEQVVLQAVRDSWFTFRGKNSSQSDDFRLQNWEEMELDEYLYAGGEVVKLWLYPRGPDSGFMLYPGSGSRHTFFHTSAVTHALGEPAWIVEPLPPGAAPEPNGLPVFRVYYENDDESTRRMGTDSQLLFTPPTDGMYVARVTDVRGFGHATEFPYRLGVRRPDPSFTVAIGGRDPKVSAGSGRELVFTVTRNEGFEGPVRIEIENLPPGFSFHGPIEIEAGQREARGVLSAAVDAAAPDEAADKAVAVKAIGVVGGRDVVVEAGSLGDIQVEGQPKLTVAVVPAAGSSVVEREGEPLEFTIRPGETIVAKVRTVRHDFKGGVEFGKEGAGRNLPHGVFIDNLGLNGLLVVEGQDEREFFITAAPKAAPGRRLFHLRANPDGGQVSPPVWLNVLPASAPGPATRAVP